MISRATASAIVAALILVLALSGGVVLIGCSSSPGADGGGGGGGGGGTATVTGSVRHDQTLAPLNGAQVAADGQAIGTTNALGEFQGGGLTPGSVSFTISLAGFDTLVEARTIVAGANDIRAAPFFLRPTLLPGRGIVTGRVITSGGASVGGATVTVQTTESGVATTKTDGTFAVYNIPAGNGTLTAQGTANQPGAAGPLSVNVPSGGTFNAGLIVLSTGPPPPPVFP